MASWARVAIEIESGDELKVLDRIERLADEQDKICEQGAALFLSCETRGSGSGEVRIEQRWARKHRSQERVKCHPATRARPEKLRASDAAEEVQRYLMIDIYTTEKRARRYNPATVYFDALSGKRLRPLTRWF